MADGVWRLTEEGEFILSEPYATQMREAKQAATKGWTEALIDYLAPRCPYSADFLLEELAKRNVHRPESKTLQGKLDVFDTFLLEALSGDL